MWVTVGSLSTAIALIGFLAAVALTAYRLNLTARAKLIRSLPANARGDLLAKELNTFEISARDLTQEQQAQIALREIDLRKSRALFGTIIVICLAFITGTVTIFSSSAYPKPPTTQINPPNSDDIAASVTPPSLSAKLTKEVEMVESAEGCPEKSYPIEVTETYEVNSTNMPKTDILYSKVAPGLENPIFIRDINLDKDGLFQNVYCAVRGYNFDNYVNFVNPKLQVYSHTIHLKFHSPD